ncbi:hypothetical protein VMCG_06267 [Cytospora schulzeri]|uniref:HIT-type domain-containing protein n=1 Tax=Cytospora schulzeri TaxID=448051 RepID=A0A423W964_9PEZI|nr:hypothetical protein VMCG_06267 [Valsa malicola]
MNNFGVIEVASAKTTHAPGWAYVPDTPTASIPSQSVSAVHLHVNRKKRAARAHAADPGSSASSATVQEGISARHSAKVTKEIEQLQRDSFGGRDAHVAVPSHGSGGGGGGGGGRGHTPNVRKILASQKTFANHLDDFEAWSRTQVQQQGAAQGEGPHRSQGQSLESTPVPGAPGGGAGSKRAAASQAQRKGGSSSARGKTPANSNNKKSATPAPAPSPAPDHPDTVMADAPPPPSTTGETEAKTDDDPSSANAAEPEPDSQILTPYTTRFTTSRPCPGDADPLLESWLPPLPSDEELRELIRAPPLNYHQARGVWRTGDDGDGKRYPPRQFCEVCGYWGRVRCMKCGTRVCALDCMDVHREECVTRYGL